MRWGVGGEKRDFTLYGMKKQGRIKGVGPLYYFEISSFGWKTQKNA